MKGPFTAGQAGSGGTGRAEQRGAADVRHAEYCAPPAATLGAAGRTIHRVIADPAPFLAGRPGR
ncbi:hypothetical protein D5S19_29285 [Amycolatopsis panacis]|uniref:Uncharacterized protein n=1 Tax=Amycolatopsis panacis TaxID=2340917 RepID=A0A419HME3_9PSEU|nr:hypothetical protein D5S19_29285 [Amycolatopsis panacis]